ncbi:hypothetical protein [Fibrobacter sp. UWEL]|uniref:hypothetical protein n=1 Tax=Fibrobacter sp. UWEL TaxID=1896209 RepID=UPI000911DB26|nr:hypothetical protein [Fibrobacter sp. UWEL]SHL01208.1 hypothetical protein SAMN05720468_11176 [Fibrobacter sp. UWEL]
MQNKLDFSGLERLTPRADSWEKVCARLDAESLCMKSKKESKRSNIIPFRLLSAIPLAASVALVGLSVLMTAFSNASDEISVNKVTSTEVASWYSNLGNHQSDDFDTLDENVTLSYFYKESK